MITKEEIERIKRGAEVGLEKIKNGLVHSSMAYELKETWETNIDLCSLALERLAMEEKHIAKPRRKIVILAKFEADDWQSVRSTFNSLELDIARHGELSKTSISGGYSSGHIIVCNVDGNMDHDKWYADLDAHLSSLPKVPHE
jgi:hypothetical protein